jgi:replicative DNA helicase
VRVADRHCKLQEQAVLEDKLEFASRLWCSDFTSEALGMLLANSNEQMSVLSDEGGLALYNMLGRYTKGDITDDILLCKGKTVNAHAVDRVGRAPIVLNHPCITLLLLVQPDLLQKAFSNQRLLVGGFLARCLAADSKMEDAL